MSGQDCARLFCDQALTDKGMAISAVENKEAGQAVKYACLLLKYRPRSCQEIIDRLKRKEYSKAVITAAIERLIGYGYIDDEAFAKVFVQSRVNQGWGRRRIAFALKKLGVDEGIVNGALPDKELSRTVLQTLIARKAKVYKNKKNPRQSLLRFLTARGFDYDEIVGELERADI